MMQRKEILEMIYNDGGEDGRLFRSRHGQLEYITTMHYINEYAPDRAEIIEIGAGTGRYSIALAQKGHDVTAVDYIEKNLEILNNNAKDIKNLKAYQGDAVDLSRFKDNSFDMVLVLGPMYHLYSKTDVQCAIDEAIRIARPNAVLMFAFLPICGLMFTNYIKDEIADGIKENYDDDFRVRHFAEQGFTGYDIEEIERLFDGKPTKMQKMVGTDSVLELVERFADLNMSDEDFDVFADYHLHICEKREIIGANNHLLYICRKVQQSDLETELVSAR